MSFLYWREHFFHFMKLKHNLKLTVGIVSLLFVFGCLDNNSSDIAPPAENFLNEVLDVMQANSINRHNIDWPVFRAKVFEKARGAQSVEETYPAIDEALRLLQDNHSSFITPNGQTIFVGQLNCNAPTIAVPTVPNNIGYVKVNAFIGASNSTQALIFANQIQDQIRNADDASMVGWIVDLRGNHGGNMWPMVVGIGPILGEGTAGYFIDPDGNESSWGFSNGASLLDGAPVTQLSNSYQLISPDTKVAIVLDQSVASSGEAVAISFIGKDNSKSFGAPTCGLSTSNAYFSLSNNATLILTTAFIADRNKKTYGGPITPNLVASGEMLWQEIFTYLDN